MFIKLSRNPTVCHIVGPWTVQGKMSIAGIENTIRCSCQPLMCQGVKNGWGIQNIHPHPARHHHVVCFLVHKYTPSDLFNYNIPHLLVLYSPSSKTNTWCFYLWYILICKVSEKSGTTGDLLLFLISDTWLILVLSKHDKVDLML